MLRYGDTSLAKRMTFTGDPKTGDATVSISDAVVSDTGTYQCKVKKAPGVDMRKVTLVVMGEQPLGMNLLPFGAPPPPPPPPTTSFFHLCILFLGFFFLSAVLFVTQVECTRPKPF